MNVKKSGKLDTETANLNFCANKLFEFLVEYLWRCD